MEALSTGRERGTPWSCHHFKRPQMSQSIPEDLVFTECLNFHAEDRLTPRWHGGQPCGKASRESHRSLYPREGKRDTAATAWEESARACPRSRRGLTALGRFQKYPRHMSAVERIPQVPAPIPHKVLGPGIDGRGIPRGPKQLAWELAFPEASRAGP